MLREDNLNNVEQIYFHEDSMQILHSVAVPATCEVLAKVKRI